MTPEDERLLLEGIELFNAEQHWQAHESWERLWLRSADPERRFIQGLIQVAAGCHLVKLPGRRVGALRNLEKGADKLEQLPECLLGIDVAALRSAVKRLEEALRTLLPEGQESLALSEVALPRIVRREAVSG